MTALLLKLALVPLVIVFAPLALAAAAFLPLFDLEFLGRSA